MGHWQYYSTFGLYRIGVKTMRLYASIFKPEDMGDCTNGGVSSKARSAIIYFNENNLSQPPLDFDEDADLNHPELPVLIIMSRKIAGCEQLYLTAYPVNLFNQPNQSGMFGGNFVWTCDSRFPKIGEHSYPIPIHDRFE